VIETDSPSKPFPHASVLADRCAGIARTLTYNESPNESAAKHALREASYFIDSQIIRLHKKRDGILAINARGKGRYLTWRERLAVWLLGGRTEVRP
jgi:hypothetical protein